MNALRPVQFARIIGPLHVAVLSVDGCVGVKEDTVGAGGSLGHGRRPVSVVHLRSVRELEGARKTEVVQSEPHAAPNVEFRRGEIEKDTFLNCVSIFKLI